MNDVSLFAFEDDFVSTLRCIPMAVRFKLDACEVKVSLRQWSRLTQQERWELLVKPCETVGEVNVYRAYLIGRLDQSDVATKAPPPGSLVPWGQVDKVPQAVMSFAAALAIDPPTDRQWEALTPLQRFVLLKLSRDNHDNVNFIPALREFGVYRASEPSSEASYVASA